MGRNPGAGSAQQPEHRTLEGLAIRALYASQPCSDREAGGFPGAAPYVRGTRATRDPQCPWWNVALLPTDTPEAVNAAALEELEGGASGLQLPPTAARWSEAQLARALEGVLLTGIALHGAGAGSSAALADRLSTRARAVGADMEGWCLGVDPLRARATECGRAIEATEGSRARALIADATAFHEAGAHAALEIGLLLATSAQALRAGEASGNSPQRVFESLLWRLPMERDFFGGVVKLRAARLAWSALAKACAVIDIPAPFLHAGGSRRTLTLRDPHTNLVRATVQAAAAAVGGADAISLPAFDAGYGAGSALGRRLARNIALVVEHEARLLDVQDPVGGSEHAELRTRELAEAAWEEFRGLERAGGLAAMLADGRLRTRLDAEWERRSARLASGEEVVVGVNLHPAPPQERPAATPSEPWGLPRHSEEAACRTRGGGA